MLLVGGGHGKQRSWGSSSSCLRPGSLACSCAVRALLSIIGTPMGSGSFEDADPFQIVAMEEEPQTSIMHKQRFGKRESFSDKTTKALAKCIIPALYMSSFTCFLAYCCMLLFGNYGLICTPKITIAMESLISFGNRFP